MKFRISDNLPDLSHQVSRDEILILLPVAASLSPAFQVDGDGRPTPPEEEAQPRESSTVRKSQHSAAG